MDDEITIETDDGEEYTIDVLSKAIKEASLAASKCIALVNPNGRTNIKQLAATKNGGFCAGTADDVAMLQANKYYDLKVGDVILVNARVEKRFDKFQLVVNTLKYLS